MVGSGQKSSAVSFGVENPEGVSEQRQGGDGIFATAAVDENTAGVLLANYDGPDTRVMLHLNGMDKISNIKIRTTDRFNTDRRDFVPEAGAALPVTMMKNSVVYLEFDT